ncbi:MAG: FMN-binding protein [Spirochaetota bacterium]|nr:MAG: FMN-binding protein [Spirochaetota bacterium]
MSNEGKTRSRIFPVFFMLIITLVFISVTTVIYTFTKDTIKFQETLRQRRAVLNAAGATVPDEPDQVQELYLERIEEIKDNKGSLLYYAVKGDDPDTIMSYVIVAVGAGLWGEITAAVGFDEDGQSITGIEIIDQNETPGLGGRISEAWFNEQFRGKQPPISSVPEGEPFGSNEVQAITGASYSTAAIMDLVNTTSEVFLSHIKE